MNKSEVTRIGEGSLNALIIANPKGLPRDMTVIVADAVETRGNEPGPAERALKVKQDEVAEEAIAQARQAGVLACIADEVIRPELSRIGDESQTIRVEFQCSAP